MYRNTPQNFRIPQLVEDEGGNVVVPMYDWQAFLSPFLKPVKGIMHFHLFPLVKMFLEVEEHVDWPTECIQILGGDSRL